MTNYALGRLSATPLLLWRSFLAAATLAGALCVFLLCKAYIRHILLWLENRDPLTVAITITLLYFIVALPISIGYIVLVAAEGYLFGVWRGLALVVFGANLALIFAHNLLRAVSHHESLRRFSESETAKAIIRVINGPLCFKIVFCARLTPIPFGLQNTIFAVSNVSPKVYHLASLFGLLPAQFVAVYFGSTLRSMQDVLENKHISSTTYIFISLQLILAILLMFWFGSKARVELVKVLSDADNIAANTHPSYSSIV